MTPHPPRARIALALLMATLGLLGLVARPAAAAEDVTWTAETATNSFGAGRPDYRYTLNPGGRAQDGIVVVNHGATPVHLALRAAAGATNAAGEIDLVAKDGASPGLRAWVQLDRDDVTVEPGKSVEVPFVLALPGDAAPGDHVGGIVTSRAEDAEQRVGVEIHLRVGGALKPKLSVENVRISYAGTANPIGKGDAIVTYAIHNTGNAILAARQAVSVSGPFGRWDAEVGKLGDTPPLLPGERWKVSAPLRDVTPALRLTATVTLVPLLTDAAGSTAPLPPATTSGHAWTIPWTLLLVIVVVLGLVVAGLASRRRRAPV
jgi:hypothetical protein